MSFPCPMSTFWQMQLLDTNASPLWMATVVIIRYLWSQQMPRKSHLEHPFRNYYKKMMSFGLKNTGATYQRTMTLIFGDMLHKQVEDYVDDLVIKAKNLVENLLHLRQVFERCREYNLRMKPSKCAFGVSSRRFLGFLVHQRGIDLDPTKAKAIAALSPATLKELRSFVGKVPYLRRFIPGLAEILKPLVE